MLITESDAEDEYVLGFEINNDRLVMSGEGQKTEEQPSQGVVDAAQALLTLGAVRG